MHIRNNVSTINSKDSTEPKPIWRTLGRIQHAIGINDHQMAEYMHMSSKQFVSSRARKIEPSVTAAMILCKAIHIGFDSLVLDNVDYTALAEQYSGNKSFFAEK